MVLIPRMEILGQTCIGGGTIPLLEAFSRVCNDFFKETQDLVFFGWIWRWRRVMHIVPFLKASLLKHIPYRLCVVLGSGSCQWLPLYVAFRLDQTSMLCFLPSSFLCGFMFSA